MKTARHTRRGGAGKASSQRRGLVHLTGRGLTYHRFRADIQGRNHGRERSTESSHCRSPLTLGRRGRTTGRPGLAGRCGPPGAGPAKSHPEAVKGHHEQGSRRRPDVDGERARGACLPAAPTTPAPAAPRRLPDPAGPRLQQGLIRHPIGSEGTGRYWSGRYKALQTQLERDRDVRRRTAVAASMPSPRSTSTQGDRIQQAKVATDRQKALDELNRLTKAIADGKKAIADFQEEARRSGIPPGWLR